MFHGCKDMTYFDDEILVYQEFPPTFCPILVVYVHNEVFAYYRQEKLLMLFLLLNEAHTPLIVMDTKSTGKELLQYALLQQHDT